jgi:hypothetical protein
MLIQDSENSATLYDPISLDVYRTYALDITEGTKVLDIKYANNQFLIEIGDDTEVLSTKEIVLK